MNMASAIASSRHRQSRADVSRILAALAAHAQLHPNHLAACTVGAHGESLNVLTYGDLAVSARGLARALASMVDPGDVVMLTGLSSPRYLQWLCACLACGVRVLPIHGCSTPIELRAACTSSGAVAMIVPDECTAARDLPIRRIPFDLDVVPDKESTPVSQLGAIVLQSSGTTGLPKLVLREHAALDAVASNVARALGLSPDDRVLATMPLCHSYGIDMVLATLKSGASLAIVDSFDPTSVAESLLKDATVFPAVPVVFEALSRFMPTKRPARLRLAFSAGAPMPQRIGRLFQSHWGQCIGQLYGATELGSVTFNHPASSSYSADSVGTPMDGVSVRIVDPEDPSRTLSTGCEGQVAIWAPSMLSAYLGDDVPLIEQHFLTGDLGSIGHENNLYITGRLKLLIDVGGFKVNPLEVEAAIATHPAINECAVVPMHVTDTVTRLRAVFVTREGHRAPTADALRQYVRNLLSGHKVPRVFECAPSLPRSAAGKLLRHRIAGGPC